MTFLPTSISGCQLWFDGSNASSITQSSGNISQWNDLSGNANNASVGAPYQPTVVASAQNGLNAVRFTAASSQYLALGSAVNVDSAYTVATVVKRGGPSGTGIVELLGYSSSAGLTLEWHSDQHIYVYNSSGYTGTASAVTDTGFDVIIVTATGTTVQIYVNGVLQSLSGWVSGSFPANIVYVGYGDGYMNGDIGEIALYNSVLASGDITNLYNYLYNKWFVSSVSASLPLLDPVITYLLANAGTLPTSLPGTADTVWNDGGIISYTGTPTASSVFYNTPTTLPSNNYVWWLNGGVFSVTGDAATIATNYLIPSSPSATYPIWNDNGVLSVSSIYSGSTVFTSEVAGTSASVGAVIRGVLPPVTSATASATSLGVQITPATLAQVAATCSATSLTISSIASVNVTPPQASITASDTSLTTTAAFLATQVNTAAVVYSLGNLYVNAGTLAQANANVTANVLYGNIQVTSPKANTNATANAVYSIGMSQANSSVSVASIYGNVQITSPITNATALVHSFGNLYVNVVSSTVTATTGYGSVFANVQVTSSITNASPSATSLTVTTGLTVGTTQASAVATVNPFGNLYVNVVSSTVVTTTGYGSVFGNVQVVPSITNANASTISLIAYGLSEANCLATAGSVSGNIQITSSITNASSSTTSLTVVVITTASINAVSATTTVNPLGNLYVNVVSSITNATANCGSVFGNVQANVAITNATANVYVPGNLYINVVSTKANVTVTLPATLQTIKGNIVNAQAVVATATVKSQKSILVTGGTFRTYPSQANATISVSSLAPIIKSNAVSVSAITGFGVVGKQVSVFLYNAGSVGSQPTQIGLATGPIATQPLTGQYTASSGSGLTLVTSVVNTVPNIFETISIVGATTSATSLNTISTSNKVYLNQINVSATVNPFGNLYVNTASLAQANPSVSTGSVKANIQVLAPITNATVSTTTLIAYGLSQANSSISITPLTPLVSTSASITNATAITHSLISYGISQVNTAATYGSITPQIISNAISVIATSGVGSLISNNQVNAVSVVLTSSASSLTDTIQISCASAIATTAVPPTLAVAGDKIFFINQQATVNAITGGISPQIGSNTTQVSALGGLGSVTPTVSKNAVSVSATVSALSLISYGLSQANVGVTCGSVTSQVNIVLARASALAGLGSAVSVVSSNASSLSALTSLGSTYENIQITLGRAIATASLGSIAPEVDTLVPKTNVTVSTKSLISYGLSQANASISLGSFTPKIFVGSSSASVITSVQPLTESTQQKISQALATTSFGSIIPEVDVGSSVVSGTATIQEISVTVTSGDVSIAVNPAVATTVYGSVYSQVNTAISSVSATTTATILHDKIEITGISEASTSASSVTITTEINLSSSVAISTAHFGTVVPSLSTFPSQAVAETNAVDILSQIDCITSQALTSVNLGQVIAEIDTTSEVSVSVSALSLSSKTFVEVPPAMVVGIAVDVVPTTLVISGTTSASTSSRATTSEIEVVSPQAFASAITRPVSTFSYLHTYVPVGPATCEIDANDIIAEISPNILSVSASTTARSSAETLLGRALQVSVQTKAAVVPHQVAVSISGVNATLGVASIGEEVLVSPRIVISAQANPITKQVAIACPQVSISTTVQKVSEIVAGSPSSVSAYTGVGSLIPEIFTSISSVTATTQAESPTTQKSLENVFVAGLPVYATAIAESIIPDMEVAVSGVVASGFAFDTWSAGVPFEAHCWTVLGVLKLQILSTWGPGRGVKLRGKSDGVWLKGMSDEVKLRGKDTGHFGEGLMINIRNREGV